MRLLSQDLLDFLKGPWHSHQARLLRILTDWQMSALSRVPIAEDELREEAEQYTYGRYRRSLSPWIVWSLGRVAKMNLNSSTSAETAAEWRERTK